MGWQHVHRYVRPDDPLEYAGNRRRDFWAVMNARAKRGDRYAEYALAARSEFEVKIARQYV